MSNPEIGCAISLAEAMHIPVITASPIDEFQQKSYLISVAYRMGLKLKKNLKKKKSRGRGFLKVLNFV